MGEVMKVFYDGETIQWLLFNFSLWNLMESTILVAIAAQAWIGIYSCKMEIKVRKSIPHVTAGIRSTSLKQDAN